MKFLFKTGKLLLATVALPLSLPLVSMAQTQSPVVEDGSDILQIESKEQSDWRFASEQNNRTIDSQLEIDPSYNLDQDEVDLSTTDSEERWGNKGDRNDFIFTVPVEEF